MKKPHALPLDEAAAAAGLDRPAARWPALLGLALTLAMVAGLGRELLGDGLAGLTRSVPRSPIFYLAFIGLYLAQPVGDFVIFRRLWGLPAAGFAALVKKRIANEVVFGYSGEAYFYAWARANASAAAPFGAVKDVAVLSALAGNAFTLLLMAGAAPVAAGLLPDRLDATWGVSALVLVAMTVPFLLFSRRVFTLPRPELWRVFAVHLVRNMLATLLIAGCWAAALPGVAAGTLLLLAAGRMLVSRLPFVPNKELLFANLAVAAMGTGALAGVVAFTAALTLVVHVALLAGFGLAHLVGARRAPLLRSAPD